MGEHVPDPDDPKRNTIGGHKSVPNTDDALAYPYRVLGTNCGWWACKMVLDAGIEIDEETLEKIKKYNHNIGLDGKGPTNDEIEDWEQYLKNSEGLGALSILHNIAGNSLESATGERKTRTEFLNDTAVGISRFYKWCRGEDE